MTAPVYEDRGPREAVYSERMLVGRCLVLSSRAPIEGLELVSDAAGLAREIRSWPGHGDLLDWCVGLWLRRGVACERSDQYAIDECDVEEERAKVLAAQGVRGA